MQGHRNAKGVEGGWPPHWKCYISCAHFGVFYPADDNHVISYSIIVCVQHICRNMKDIWPWTFYASAANSRWREALCGRSSVRSSVRCPSVRYPSVPLACDTISPYLVEAFAWNLEQIFVMFVGIAESVFKVRGQRSRLSRGQMHSSSWGVLIDLYDRLSVVRGRKANRSTLWRWGWLAFRSAVCSLRPPRKLCNARRLSVCLFVCLLATLYAETTEWIFAKVLLQMCLWTTKNRLNFGSHTDSRSGPDSPWRRSALSECS